MAPKSLKHNSSCHHGSLFISEECEDGVLIRPAQAVPRVLAEVRLKIQQGLEELDQGRGLPGKQVEAELKALSKAARARKAKASQTRMTGAKAKAAEDGRTPKPGGTQSDSR